MKNINIKQKNNNFCNKIKIIHWNKGNSNFSNKLDSIYEILDTKKTDILHIAEANVGK